MRLELTVNGDPYRRDVAPDASLLDVLRDDLGLTGTKWGCLTGDCGACTVLVDGAPVVSCLQLAQQVCGAEVTTVEGLGEQGELGDIQAAFVRNGAAQCGFCTPGMIVAAEALLRHNGAATETEIREALQGNLCRCTGYNKIVDAVLEAGRARTLAT
jgi:aerobic-type carbon monoxide dehydrogenase small subunit (CoxS/CutS family)